MSNFDLSDNQMSNVLDALTEALLTEQHDIDKLLNQYGIPRGSLNGLIDLIYNLHNTFVRQQPSDDFVRSLKRDLVGDPDGIVERVRALPGRVHIAAGLAAIAAGCLLILRRRIMGNLDDGIEIPVLQQ